MTLQIIKLQNTLIKKEFKACARSFFSYHQKLIFSQPLNNSEKCFLFHLKSAFRSQDIQIFVFSTSLQFFPVSHSLRG